MAEEIFYSALHWAKKAEKAQEAIEGILPKAEEAANKAFWGNIGDIKYTARTSAPNGGAWCDGASYSKEQYPDVYKMLTDGNLLSIDIDSYNSTVETNGSCGLFGLDTASESFRVPSLNDVYIKSGQVADEFGAESLPNITGKIVYDNSVETSGTEGCFSINSQFDNRVMTGETHKGYITNFDASLSSSTYQDGAKVNPDHVCYRAYIVLFTAEKELSVVNWTNQINQVAADRMAELQAGGLTTIKYWE